MKWYKKITKKDKEKVTMRCTRAKHTIKHPTPSWLINYTSKSIHYVYVNA